MTPQDIEIKEYPATATVARAIYLLHSTVALILVLVGVYLLLQVEMKTMGAAIGSILCAMVVWFIGQLISEGLRIMVDLTQAAQASVVLERERMTPPE
jgi:hypothetical protein